MELITTTRVRPLIPSIRSQWCNTLARTLQRSPLLWLCNNNRQTWYWQVLIRKRRRSPRRLRKYAPCGSDTWGAPTSRRRCATHWLGEAQPAAIWLLSFLGAPACHVIMPSTRGLFQREDTIQWMERPWDRCEPRRRVNNTKNLITTICSSE